MLPASTQAGVTGPDARGRIAKARCLATINILYPVSSACWPYHWLGCPEEVNNRGVYPKHGTRLLLATQQPHNTEVQPLSHHRRRFLLAAQRLGLGYTVLTGGQRWLAVVVDIDAEPHQAGAAITCLSVQSEPSATRQRAISERPKPVTSPPRRPCPWREHPTPLQPWREEVFSVVGSWEKARRLPTR